MGFFAQIREGVQSLTGHPLWMGLGIGFSLILFIGSLALLPLFASLIPENYFMPPEQNPSFVKKQRWWIAKRLLHFVKNIFGIILIVFGFIMLVTPGQGLLTIFLGFLFLNFPGKRRLELALIRLPTIYRGINKLRSFRGKPPLRLPS